MPVEGCDDEEGELVGAKRVDEEMGPDPIKIPEAPSREEQLKHELAHVPFAAWCPRCVQAKGHDDPHRGKEEIDKATLRIEELPVVQIDFSYIDGLCLLTLYSLELGVGAATVIPIKGADNFQIAWACRALRWMGHSDILIQCDQENSARAVADAIAVKRKEKTLVRETARKSHQSLGGDERWK